MPAIASLAAATATPASWLPHCSRASQILRRAAEASWPGWLAEAIVAATAPAIASQPAGHSCIEGLRLKKELRDSHNIALLAEIASGQ